MAGLTELEQAVLRHAAEGLTIAATARAMGKSTPAAQDARHRLLVKLGAKTTAQAVLLACQAGILDGRRRRHGDHAGYEAHRRRSEAICDLCREGERAHRRAVAAAAQRNQEAA
ncbi:hypothetical protein [Streptomyces sp. NPDC058667]|uniref:hypothetical protein n=1 Tax=Streptomyces sp. NPDC058667 TaxID=3346588 RepID=UPI00365D9453